MPVMLCIMRTTISLDDQLAKQVRLAADANAMSVSAFIARTLHDALKCQEKPAVSPFRLVTVSGVRPRLGADLDSTRALEAYDDEVQFGPRPR